jgi:hypothetical protein
MSTSKRVCQPVSAPGWNGGFQGSSLHAVSNTSAGCAIRGDVVQVGTGGQTVIVLKNPGAAANGGRTPLVVDFNYLGNGTSNKDEIV